METETKQPAATPEKTETQASLELGELLASVKSGQLTVDEAKQKVKDAGRLAALVEMLEARRIPKPMRAAMPAWVRKPNGLAVPLGRTVVNLRFPSAWTDNPLKGLPLPVEDEEGIRIAGEGGLWRQCMLWPLTDTEENAGIQRAMSDANRLPRELSKQMIRAIDGHEANWLADYEDPGSVDAFWVEIGAKCRAQIVKVYHALHVLGQKEQQDFFESCVAVRIGVG